VTGGDGQGQSRLFHITTGMQSLVDTGADVKVSHLECKHPQNLRLEEVNHTPITT
jgi:hypothetical protein